MWVCDAPLLLAQVFFLVHLNHLSKTRLRKISPNSQVFKLRIFSSRIAHSASPVKRSHILLWISVLVIRLRNRRLFALFSRFYWSNYQDLSDFTFRYLAFLLYRCKNIVQIITAPTFDFVIVISGRARVRNCHSASRSPHQPRVAQVKTGCCSLVDLTGTLLQIPTTFPQPPCYHFSHISMRVFWRHHKSV